MKVKLLEGHVRLWPYDEPPEESSEWATFIISVQPISVPPVEFSTEVEPYVVLMAIQTDNGFAWRDPNPEERAKIGNFLKKYNKRKEIPETSWYWMRFEED